MNRSRKFDNVELIPKVGTDGHWYVVQFFSGHTPLNSPQQLRLLVLFSLQMFVVALH